MTVWKANSTEKEPETRVVQWSIYEVEHSTGEKTRHIVGYVPSLREGRVSSMIVGYDPETMTAKTRSGRKYFLEGSSGSNSDANYVFDTWVFNNKIVKSVDVSNEYVVSNC